jgi:hypothetical protein
MSRTIRRKNAWNKQDFIDCDLDWLKHMAGMNPFPYIKFQRRKYNGCSVEKIKKRLEAKFHSDNLRYRESDRDKKEWSKWRVRFHLNADLQKALALGEEENLYNTEREHKKRINDRWLWWD